MSHRALRLILTVMSGLFALTGCSSHRQLATQAVGFNLTVEKAQNEMLLLNVIRAKDRLPMYMTGISSLSGNVATSLSTGVSGSYTRSKGHVPSVLDTLTRSVTPSVGASLSTNPSFSLAVLDTQEFMKGFLSPVSTETLAYYWNQGWPKDLLLYLLVQRVEIGSSAGGPPLVVRNYPDSEDPSLNEVKRFGCWLRGFLSRNPRIENIQDFENVGPQLSRYEVSDVEKLVQIAKEGLLITTIKNGDEEVYQLQRRRASLSLKLDNPPTGPTSSTGKEKDCDGFSFDPPKPLAAATEAKSDEASRQQQPYEQVPAEGKIRTMLPDSTTVTLILRSPEGLVYYLGELMRVANRKDDSPRVPYFCLQGRSQPLFVARPADSDHCEESLLEADAGRGRFSIPGTSNDLADCEEGELRLETATKCEPGRSMHALRLLSQLMSLHKSAKDLPSTAVVRVLN
jgi:hypothetical protein